MREGVDPCLCHIRIGGQIKGRVEKRVWLESGRCPLLDVVNQRMVVRTDGVCIFLPVIARVEKGIGIAVLRASKRRVVGQQVELSPLKVRVHLEIIDRVEEHGPFDQEVIPKESQGPPDLERPNPGDQLKGPLRHSRNFLQARERLSHGFSISLIRRSGRVSRQDVEFTRSRIDSSFRRISACSAPISSSFDCIMRTVSRSRTLIISE